MKHHFLTPLQDAAPHVQSKQHLKLFLIISESVDCLVCSDEDLRRNILTDFASIIWLTVSIHKDWIPKKQTTFAYGQFTTISGRFLPAT